MKLSDLRDKAKDGIEHDSERSEISFESKCHVMSCSKKPVVNNPEGLWCLEHERRCANAECQNRTDKDHPFCVTCRNDNVRRGIEETMKLAKAPGSLTKEQTDRFIDLVCDDSVLLAKPTKFKQCAGVGCSKLVSFEEPGKLCSDCSKEIEDLVKK